MRPEGATEKVIAIDGKTVRGSRDGYHDNPAIQLVHAWSVEDVICLGQRKTRDKSNEIVAIPELLYTNNFHLAAEEHCFIVIAGRSNFY